MKRRIALLTAALLLLMAVVSALAGALWSYLPAVFKAKYDTNETLFTLMMNYVAIQFVEFFVVITKPFVRSAFMERQRTIFTSLNC